MTTLQVLSGKLEDGRRRDYVYSGDLLVFKDVSPLIELCGKADALIRGAFGALEPVLAQFQLERDHYVARVDSLQTQFRKDPVVIDLFRAALEDVGVDVGRTYWDALYLRVLPHGESHASRRTSKLGFHRDTWSSNVYSQTNWWTPIYPITSDRTIVFCPGYWSRPIENTSRKWDLAVIRARRRDPSAKLPTLPVVPQPSERVDLASELRIVIEPGDLLCFSGAHLHASVPNVSGVARFSIEARTVDVEDVMRERGAPNVDGQAPHVALEWFRSVEDGTPLSMLSGRDEQAGALAMPGEAGRGTP